jgi:hypothetical protein
MSDREPDELFRERVMRVASEDDRLRVGFAAGTLLDLLGRKYSRFRTGVPLKGLGPHQT